jgi:hypothetical protein
MFPQRLEQMEELLLSATKCNSIRQTGMNIAQSLVSEPSSFEVKIASRKI